MKTLKSKIVKVALAIGLLILVAISVITFLYKSKALRIDSETTMQISSSDSIESISAKLSENYGLKFPSVFNLVAKRMNLNKSLKNGRYHLVPNMTIVELVRVFREGKNRTVNLTFNGNNDDFGLSLKYVGQKLEPDIADFTKLYYDSAFIASLGFNDATITALPIPDTYNFYWHTSPQEFFQRLKKEYDKFWNNDRLLKAEQCGLTPIEVATLASIVCKETNKVDEMPMVAGMYLNRLRIEMPLQADPTIKFALGEPGLKRILNIHLKVESPYNTYMNKGLPPGPICVPTKQALEAVLNFSQHGFVFMCAKEDFSGYHNFSSTYAEHLKNAHLYQTALDQRGIK
ncbi:MAG: endolytic transglycosylase MltG [bacterium]|nr:endolytic transglycosylase MltG [bacterium]